MIFRREPRPDRQHIARRDPCHGIEAQQPPARRHRAIQLRGRAIIRERHPGQGQRRLRMIEQQRTLHEAGRAIAGDGNEFGELGRRRMAQAQHIARLQKRRARGIEEQPAPRRHRAGNPGGEIGAHYRGALPAHGRIIRHGCMQPPGKHHALLDRGGRRGHIFGARAIQDQDLVARGEVGAILDAQQHRPGGGALGQRGDRGAGGHIPEQIRRGEGRTGAQDPVHIDPPGAIVEGALHREGQRVAFPGIDARIQHPAEDALEIPDIGDERRAVHRPALGHADETDGRGGDPLNGLHTPGKFFDKNAGRKIFGHGFVLRRARASGSCG